MKFSHETIRVPLFLSAVATLMFVATDATPPSAGSLATRTTAVDTKTAAAATPRPADGEPPTSRCATLRDVVGGDIVRVEGDRIYFLSEARGLLGFDVADVDHPHEIAHEPLLGEPIAIFVRPSVLIAIVADWESPEASDTAPTSLVRVYESGGPHELSVREDHVLSGTIRSAFMVDDTLYVVRDEKASDATEEVVLSTYSVARGGLVPRGELRVPGAAVQLDVVNGRLLLARRLAPSAVVGDVGTELMASDADLDPSGLSTAGGTLDVRGFLAPSAVGLADGDRFTALVTCATAACAPGEPVFVEIADTENIFAPKLVAEVESSALDGPPVTAFDGEHLLIAGNHGYARADGTTIVRIVDVEDRGAIVPRGAVLLRGSVSNIVLSGDHAFAVGSVATPTSAVRITVQEIDVAAAHRPTVVGAIVFGADWSWSLAQETASALGLDEENSTVALPFRTLNQSSNQLTGGVELLRHAPGHIWPLAAVPLSDAPERVLFIDDRVVAVGASGVSVVRIDSDGRPRVVSPRTSGASEGRAELDTLR